MAPASNLILLVKPPQAQFPLVDELTFDLTLTPALAHWGWCYGQLNVTRLKSAAMFVTGKCVNLGG